MKTKKYLPLITIILLLVSGFLRTLFNLSVHFSEFYTLKIAPLFRIPLSLLTYPFPFSVFESVVLIFSLFVLMTLLSGVKIVLDKILRLKKRSYFKVYLKIVLYSISFAFIIFVFSFEASYKRNSIDKNIGLEKVEMNKENISLALDIVLDEIEIIKDEIDFTPYRESVLPLSFNELKKEMMYCTDKANDKYNYLQEFSSPAKPIAFSAPLAYTGISGIYGFLTGEANINTVFSDYTIPFTMAHEYSHQRGIGPENEAEFSAFLICLESDVPYVRYSAYSQVAVTLANLLYEYDENLFYEKLFSFPDLLYYDIVISAKNYEEYSKTVVDEVASSINNAYLISNGDEGVISYSLSSELYVSYLLKGVN